MGGFRISIFLGRGKAVVWIGDLPIEIVILSWMLLFSLGNGLSDFFSFFGWLVD